MEKILPKVSIITINYNQSEVTCELLASLRKISYPNIEIVVIDNASPNDTPLVMKERYPEINLIQAEENTGFAGGNNIGIEQASGDLFLFINNDVEVEPHFLEPLVAKFSDDKSMGVVSPKIRYHHTPDTIQYAGCTPINPFTTRGDFIGHGEKDNGQYDRGHETHYAHGAAMLVHKNVVERVGMMPDIYFLYYEELDWCNRIKEANYKIYYEPQSTVFHKESISVGKHNPLKTFYMTRNRLVYIRRNLKGIYFLLSMLYFLFISIPKNTVVLLVKRQSKLLKAFYKGVFWNLSHHNIYRIPLLNKS